ncbi:long-chain fatty acid--CoA ligase [Desulfovibrio legallii]|uniref:Long-chain fatty acid--CoA ligase n=2 Tax=Desulfovibrio TaxID=872 RepID=A0A6H3FBS4_9BACT|nr:long-chain fatty acid--CoA ligase [Desulfovibrio legallii]RHH25710.1 long-chain fatty acid--CoA ligase [Desulfovibrio sp. AM18-2]TBH79933.1 long-chain fatty acid--CoA ligase [Desulfovibrio legallii]
MSTELTRPWFDHYDAFVPHTASVWNKPLYAMLDEAAEKYPNRYALIFQNTRITYKKLRERAELFAGALRRMGVRSGQRVAIMLPNLPQTMIAFWGVIKAGAVVVMTNPLYMEKEIVANMQDSGAEHMILLDMLWPRIDALRDRLPLRNFIVTSAADSLSFPLNWLYKLKKRRSNKAPIPYDNKNVFAWQSFCKGARRYAAPIADPQRDPIMLQYTGGTTGLPKGVVLTHANLGTNCRQVLNIINVRPETHHTFISLLPFFHVYGLTTGLIIPMALASTTLPLPRYVPQDVLRLIDKRKPTIFPGAPSVYISLLQQKNLNKFDLGSIQICVSGSAPLPREIFRRFQEATGAAILEGYGLTEASPITHINPLGKQGQRANSIGMPVPGTDARIVDMEGGSLTLPPGKMGELVVQGPQVMHGYWRRPDETASALRNGWLYTGDLASMDEDGYFYILDRKKDMVLVGGYNVYPREVDEVLLEHPKVLEAVSVGIGDDLRGEVLKAYVVPRQGETLTKADIIAWCRQKLANYKVPRLVEFRESLPKTIVGKVLRRALREEEEQKRAQRKKRRHDADAAQPAGTTEEPLGHA